MQRRLISWIPIGLIVILGVLAGFGRLIEFKDNIADDQGIPAEIMVSSEADRGPGSLRAALFLSMKAEHAVTIKLQVDRIDLEYPLPPISVSKGLTIVGGMPAPTALQYRGPSGEGIALMHIASDDVHLSNIAIDATGVVGIIVSGAKPVFDNISISNAIVAVRAIDPEQLDIRNSQFAGNKDGVRIEGSSGSARIVGNSFTNNSEYGLWLVFNGTGGISRKKVLIGDNRFTGGRVSLVAFNSFVDLRNNNLSGFSSIGLALSDSRAFVVNNRIHDSRGIGMHASNLNDSLIGNNELARNDLVGILILDASGLQVSGNNLYNNGYGLVAVGRRPISATVRDNTLVDNAIDGLISIGETPLIHGNHSLSNRQAGMRILDLELPGEPLIAATPRYSDNVFHGNGDDNVLFGSYVVMAP